MSSGLSLKEIDNPYGNISKFSGFNFNISSYSHNIPPGKITLSFKHIQVTQNYDN